VIGDPSWVGLACVAFTTVGLVGIAVILGLVLWLERRRYVERKRLLAQAEQLRRGRANRDDGSATSVPPHHDA
jgi:hypothetical protein